MELFNELVEKEQLSIVFKGNHLKAVLPKFTDINLNSIMSLFNHASSSTFTKIGSDKISSYLSKFQSEVSHKKSTEKNQNKNEVNQ